MKRFSTATALLLFTFTLVGNIYASSSQSSADAEVFKYTAPDSTVTVRPDAMSSYPDVEEFIIDICKKNKLDSVKVRSAFDNAYFDSSVIALMDKPAEIHHWSFYSRMLLSRDRVANGVNYMGKYADNLSKAYEIYGVPPYVVAAIAGVESAYGTVPLKRNAVVSLGTLAFEYPRRSTYFKAELEKLFILAQKESADPLTYMGSYAGAIGIPQFMPSNVLMYGQDGDGDGHVDIVKSQPDAIYSIANFISRHGWQPDKDTIAFVSLRVLLPDDAFAKSPCSTNDRKTVYALRQMGVIFDKSYPDEARGILSRVDDDNNTYIPVVFFENACSIHKYNNSLKYTLAISVLADKIKQESGK